MNYRVGQKVDISTVVKEMLDRSGFPAKPFYIITHVEDGDIGINIGLTSDKPYTYWLKPTRIVSIKNDNQMFIVNKAKNLPEVDDV